MKKRKVTKKAPAKKKTAGAIAAAVPLPRGWVKPRDFEQLRRASGYTSVRVSKITLGLLRRVEHLSVKAGSYKTRWGYETRPPEPGLDSLLYFDALQRLGELPGRKAMGDDD